jgi:asparaginyl-tRNA synthetase
MMITLKEIFTNPSSFTDKKIVLHGWVRNRRPQKEFGFINLNDGTFFESVQVVYADGVVKDFQQVSKITVGSSIKVTGTLKLTPELKQPFEIQAETVELIGHADETYPIQPKRHTREFLREVAHLRPRTNLFSAVFRVRSTAAFAVHQFFQERNFVYVNTPLITALDGEGAGEMFQVTTHNLSELPYDVQGLIDYNKDFFGKKTSLTVTGQLEAESYALAFKNVYTFGPTFRAENSNTARHASEFWMIEPEMAFTDINENMIVIEDVLKYVVDYVLKKHPEEMSFFDQFVQPGLMERLKNLLKTPFAKCTHKDAIQILIDSKVKFENKPAFGRDLATEHEKYLTEHFNGPVFITHWPKDIKAFYMRLNDDQETVAAIDLLVPGAGELVGGSQREERYDQLVKRMTQMNIPQEDLWWYLELRKYGGATSSGFGIGFERLIMYLTGVENIRDVIAFPRTPKNAEL